MQNTPFTLSSYVRQPTAGGRAGYLFASYMAHNPDIAFATWVAGPDRAVVDLLRVPDRLQRRGIGSKVYRLWEDTLPEGMSIELFAVDADASAFWRTLGFVGPDNCVMKKTVQRLAMAA